jgi:hypothetical protein
MNRSLLKWIALNHDDNRSHCFLLVSKQHNHLFSNASNRKTYLFLFSHFMIAEGFFKTKNVFKIF